MAYFHIKALAAAMISVGLTTFGSAASAQSAVPSVQALRSATDPLKNAVLIGRIASAGMVFQLEIEGAEPMWMQMGNPPMWGAQAPGADERYHVEFKLTDPKSLAFHKRMAGSSSRFCS